MSLSISLKPIYTVDFETKPIEDHKQAPQPVGVAIQHPDGKVEYLAFGHRTGNNCTFEQAKGKIWDFFYKASKGEIELLFHNAKFDISVAILYFGVIMPPWQQLHDTQFQLIFNDPHAKDLRLKESSERLLGMKPEERDQLQDWVQLHESAAVEEMYARLKPKKPKLTKEDCAKALVWLAPVELVAKYAIGDVVRTRLLHDFLYHKILESKQDRAYDLERRILVHLIPLEMRGYPIKKKQLEEDLTRFQEAKQEAAIRIFEKLKTWVDIASPALGKVLMRKGAVTGLARNPPTEKMLAKGITEGNISTSKDSLEGAKFKDPQLKALIRYWRGIEYRENNSFQPWLDSAGAGNTIYSSWNQTRGASPDGDPNGARTLRFSVAWFLNMARALKVDYTCLEGLPKIPAPASYLLPYEGYDLIACRDISQQEYRIGAHFENGQLMQQYQDDPLLDIHTLNLRTVEDLGLRLIELFDAKGARDIIKVFDLAVLYGMGLDKTATKAKVDKILGKLIRDAIRQSIPDLIQWGYALQKQEMRQGYVRTYMGAKLTREPGFTLPNGHEINFGYKLPNHKIQRSAAEQLKEIICIWHEEGYAAQWPWYMSRHDENNICATRDDWRLAQKALAEVTDRSNFNVEMVSDLAVGTDFGSQRDLHYIDGNWCSEDNLLFEP